MAVLVKFRRDTSANLTSVNPILATGEPALDQTNRQFRIGSGATGWNGLTDIGATGATAEDVIYTSFGDGSDGDVVISSGTTTLVRDMYYNNLKISGSGKLIPAGYKIFVKNLLDLSEAQASAIDGNGTNGNNASGATAGAVPAAPVAGSVNRGGQATAGTTGTTAAGTQAGTSAAVTGNGGASGAGGAGGAGTNAGGASRTATTPTGMYLRHHETKFWRGATVLGGGAGGPGGSAGGGSGTTVAGGGGSGGNGGDFIAIYARYLKRSETCPQGVISVNGGNGGNGGNGSSGNTGGGGGAAGGGGGYIYMVYEGLVGTKARKFLRANGGVGGYGGNGTGTGASGTNGTGGNSGRILLIRPISETTFLSDGTLSTGPIPGLCFSDI
jgi:hypothetical protein